jgi:hypothetical protein
MPLAALAHPEFGFSFNQITAYPPGFENVMASLHTITVPEKWQNRLKIAVTSTKYFRISTP